MDTNYQGTKLDHALFRLFFVSVLCSNTHSEHDILPQTVQYPPLVLFANPKLLRPRRDRGAVELGLIIVKL